MEYDVKVSDCGAVCLWRSNMSEVCVVVENGGGPNDAYAALNPKHARLLAAALVRMADEIEAARTSASQAMH